MVRGLYRCILCLHPAAFRLLVERHLPIARARAGRDQTAEISTRLRGKRRRLASLDADIDALRDRRPHAYVRPVRGDRLGADGKAAPNRRRHVMRKRRGMNR